MPYQIDPDGSVDLGGQRVPVPTSVSPEARAYLAASPWLPTFLSLASVLALGPALALARRSSPSSKPSGGSGGPTSRASAAVA